MQAAIVRSESPVEYFRELVESAMRHQHLATHELTSFYVVNLLAGFSHVDHQAHEQSDDALGVRFVKALDAGGVRRRHELRSVGDIALFVSGYFSDSLHRSLVAADYYIQLGEHAYGSLARQDDSVFGQVFDELSWKFVAFVDVLGEVRDRSALATNVDLLRLYERWLRTGSRRSAELLAACGIVPTASAASSVIQ